MTNIDRIVNWIKIKHLVLILNPYGDKYYETFNIVYSLLDVYFLLYVSFDLTKNGRRIYTYLCLGKERLRGNDYKVGIIYILQSIKQNLLIDGHV